MRIIPKFLNGVKWYSSLTDFDVNKYTHAYDTSTLVNPLDLGKAWQSKQNGLGIGRYKPINITRADVQKVEDQPYYSLFTKDLFNDDGTLNDIGLAYVKLTDALIPENSLARVQGHTRWKTTNKDTYGRPGQSFSNVKDYITYEREDDLAGGRHNIFLNRGKRYFYKDEEGKEHWVDPSLIGDYNVSETPVRSGWNDNKTIYWDDYELTGSKKEILDPCVQSYIKLGMDEAQARALCSGEAVDNGNPVIKSIPEEKKVEKSNVGADDINKIPKTINKKSNFLSSLLKSELPYQLFSAGRVIADNAVNRTATNEYLEHLRPPLQSPWEAYRMVHGDYIAKQSGEQQAARLRSTASRPFTADADRLMAYLLEAVDKGNQALLNGQIRDANEFYRTNEVAAQLAIANILNRTNTANTNRQLLSQYDEMRARIKKDQKIQNMQNWDQWAQFWENRALATRDAEWKRQKDLQEAFDYSVMNYGLDDSAYKAAYKKYEEAYLDSTLISKYKAIVNDASATTEAKQIAKNKLDAFEAAEAEVKRQYKALQLAQIKAQGDYIGYDWSRAPQVSERFKQYGIALKKGGTLPKLLAGGGLVRYTPLGGSEYWQRLAWLSSSSTGSSKSSSKSSSTASDTDKEEIKLLKSMVETLNSGDLLPSDMDMLVGGLKRFFSMLKYALDGYDIDNIYRGYIDVLSQVNKAKYSANTVKEAKTHLNENKALDSFAVTLDGQVYVGKVGTQQIGRVSPDLALKIINGELPNYRILTNSDLLEVRSKLPSYAFSDDIITTAATSATSMESIAKYVKEFVGSLGSDKQSRDFFVRDFGKDAEQGLQVLSGLKSRGFSDAETAYISLALSGAGNINSLVESNIATESQLQQAKLGLLALAASLPLNMRTLLYLQGGGEKGGLQLLTNLVLKNTSSSFNFEISDVTPFNPDGTLGSSSKTGKGSSGSSGEESTDRFLEDVQKGWGASDGVITLNPGNQLELIVPSKDYNPIEAASPSSLRDALVNSTLWGIGKDNNTKIYFGDQKIPVDKLNDVVYMGEGFSRIVLPINSDGSPRFAVFEEVQKILNELNINLNDLYEGKVPADKVKKFTETLNSKGLGDLIDGNKPDLNKFGVFMVTRGLATPKAGVSDQNRFAVEQKDIDRDWYEGILSTKGLDGKVLLYETDRPNFWNPAEWDIFGASYDKIYEGTIYIPIALNPEMAAVAGGNKEKPSTAKGREKENQAWKNIQRYSNTPSTDVLQQ